ncbi:MAG TPA: polyhydroxyalkanoic acid system family protein [Thermomicrobiales bacterium]|nr:polyhydroxyalkanoic acid system family protein [Thermomicrobiales bacterium]
MPKLTVVVPHELTQDEALARVKGMVDRLRQRHGGQVTDLHEQWDGYVGTFSGKSRGMQLTGEIAVRPHDIEVSGQLPLLASAFKGQIEQRIRDGAAELLA